MKHPSELPNYEENPQNKWKTFFCLYFFNILTMLVLAGFLSLLDEGFELHLDDNHKITDILKKYPFWIIFPLICLTQPFLEELVFRLHLKFQRNYFFKCIIFLSSVIRKKEKAHIFFQYLYTSKYPIIFYFSVLVFASVHISNYELTNKILFLSPLLVLPQFIGGFFIGYIRVRYGFMMGFYFHSLNNALLLTMVLVGEKIQV